MKLDGLKGGWLGSGKLGTGGFGNAKEAKVVKMVKSL